MGQIKMTEVGRHHLRDGFGGGFVGKMAVASQNPLFQTPRAPRILKHLHIVIGFESKDICGADAFDDKLGHVSEVGDETDVGAGRAQQKSDRILRVVRNGKGFDEQIVQLKSVAGREKPPIDFGFQITAVKAVKRGLFLAAPFGFERPNCCFLSVTVAENRDLKFISQPKQAANVVRVLMRDENGRKIFRRAPDAGKSLADLTRAEPNVNEHAGFISLEISAITGGTAAKNGEFNGHTWTLTTRKFCGNFFHHCRELASNNL